MLRLPGCGPHITLQIQRLRVNTRRRVFFTLDSGAGYLQCAPEDPPPGLYCEAQSPESWRVLAAVLTPERLAKLHAAGFADPGRSPNFSKTYPFEKFSDEMIAQELLTLLFEVYAYDGRDKLEIGSEKSDR
ncbi:MAG TPA: hypothetical protein VK446_02750 [Methylocystis sp.]|nr:hypothetical protein [Methylocystis sp.]